LQRSCFSARHAKGVFRNDDAQAKGAARKPLAIRAVARIDHRRFFGDFVADLAALAPAGLWEFHESLLESATLT
jgi:hypothetical protein